MAGPVRDIMCCRQRQLLVIYHFRDYLMLKPVLLSNTGTTFTVRYLLKNLLIEDDNPCFHFFLRQLATRFSLKFSDQVLYSLCMTL